MSSTEEACNGPGCFFVNKKIENVSQPLGLYGALYFPLRSKVEHVQVSKVVRMRVRKRSRCCTSSGHCLQARLG